MKRITILNITFVFLVGFVFQGGSVFPAPAKSSAGAVSEQTLTAPQLITVVVAQPFTKIITTDFSAPSADTLCIKTSGQVGGMVQSTGIINLNQPANCFSLNISRRAFEVVKLSVMPLNSLPVKIVVANSGPLMSAGSLSQAPLKSETPVLPALSLGLVISFATISRKKIFKTLDGGLVLLRQALSLQQLQVLRC